MKINSKGIVLPRIYTKETWERGGSNERNKKYIGKYYVSWSQIESYRSKSGFNTGLAGNYEYIRNYFSGEKYPDLGWGQFGSVTEAYICYNKNREGLSDEDKELLSVADKHFSDKEKAVLETIEPLGVFQYELCYYIEELDVIILGYSDDFTPPVNNIIKKLRDYKTKSESSKVDLHYEEKKQFEIYYATLEQYGFTVEEVEYCIIERLGGAECFRGGGFESLHVGNKVWYEPYDMEKVSPKGIARMKEVVIEAVTGISETFKVYNKIAA